MRSHLIKIVLLVLLVGGVLLAGSVIPKYLTALIKGEISLPLPQTETASSTLPFVLSQGFTVSVFADGIAGVRDLSFDPRGNLMASVPADGTVIVLPDSDNNGKADGVHVAIANLQGPHGLATHCSVDELGLESICYLYIAEKDVVGRYKYDAVKLEAFDKEKLFELPVGGGHVTRSLLVAPAEAGGEQLLTSVGSSCNVCHENDERRAAILTSDLLGEKTQVYARGLRNAVFMTLHPVTGDVWATENSRDLLGDDVPPDEINIIKKGGNYGWPICYGKNMHDTDFDKNTYLRNPCMEPFETPSHINIPAHSAPLGLAFVPEEGWPEPYWHNLFVAYHGSWNRSEKTGYKIERIKLSPQGEFQGFEPFMTGFLTPEDTVIGRPVDIVTLQGGIMYISDDSAGRIYRVVYEGED